jgi:hypothetical protein
MNIAHILCIGIVSKKVVYVLLIKKCWNVRFKDARPLNV